MPRRLRKVHESLTRSLSLSADLMLFIGVRSGGTMDGWDGSLGNATNQALL